MVTVVGCFDQGIQSGWSTEEIQEIQEMATIVQKDEIIFYGIEGCFYYRSTKGWLTQKNFVYTDCDIEKSERCHNEYTKAGGNGIPFLVINRNEQTQQMRDGFDSDQMLSILAGEL